MSDATSAPLEPTAAPAADVFDPAEAIRQARAFLALQRDIAGPTRFLGPAPVLSAPTAPEVSPEGALSALPHLASGAAAPPTPAPVAAPLGAPAPPPSQEAAPPIDPASTPEAPDDSDSTVPDLFGELPDPSQDPTLSPYERIASLIPEDSPLREMNSLEEINAWLSKTVLVPIDENRINPVLGTGPADADLMVIGEAPGADEDKTGEPFVGRAGQLLDKIMDAVLFDRDEIYIANILKSRPPNNRDPLAEEVEAHIPILYKQIELIRPKMILAVGKSAGNGLLGKSSSLASLRGKFHDYYGIPLMVTYHPAALLRNPQWKRPTWEDVKLLRTRYDELGGTSRRRDS
ncbi:uracil-DNA glycosylase [Rubricoccus marinus]|uniref:uracil-DNA glycosylase n=1 Tax=Rubricoccus marinus TaxID=716817 RepID=UPI001C532618|nr:uracil-DNA glycosylase [Rubricoccus marinus]